MALLSRAHQVTRAVKNVGRLREIASTMTRFGFGAFAVRMGLKKGDSDGSDETSPNRNEPMPVRFRMLLEDLGPTFIKCGQILSGRPDLVPPEYIRELARLQDHVAPIPFLEMKPILEAGLDGRSLAECFLSFDPEPLATASIAQVHAARTHDGEDVVVKILKPDVEKIMTQDLEILETISMLLERYVPELRLFRPKSLIQELKRALLAETNFAMEGANAKRFRQNFATSDFLVIPKVYDALSSSSVLTMERLRGVKLSDLDGVRALGVSPADLMPKAMDCFFQSMLIDGFFHGDPHGGNILVLPDGRMGLIDFGSVGRLTQRAKDGLVSMFVALLGQDYDLLVVEYINLSQDFETPRSSSVVGAIQREVTEVFGPYHGLPIKDVPMGKILMDASGIAYRHRISIPRDLILVFKAIMTLEGIGRSLDPNFDITTAAAKYTKMLIKERYTPKRLGRDALFALRDLIRFAEKAPRQMGEILRQIENGEIRTNLHVSNLDTVARAYATGQARIAQSLLAGGLLVSAVLASSNESALPLWMRIALWLSASTTASMVFWRNFFR